MLNEEEIATYVRDTLTVIREELSNYAYKLKSKQLFAKIQPLRVEGAGETRTIEVEIEFLKDGNLVDFFSYFLIREGKMAVSASELRNWLREELEHVGEGFTKLQ